MTTFVFTRELDLEASELVDAAYYNDKTQELAVDLSGKVYVYDGVPVRVVNEFENAYSAGSYYNSGIMRGGFGKARRIGFWSTVDFEEDVKKPVEEAKPLGSQFNPGGIVTPNAVRTPVTPAYFNLKPASGVVNANATRKHTVVFTTGADATVRTHALEAGSVEDAVSQLSAYADALGVQFSVREVVVSFV